MLVVPEAINSEATSVENATSVLLDLPGFRVVDVRPVETETAAEDRRLVVVETVEPVAACPACGVVASGCMSGHRSGSRTCRSGPGGCAWCGASAATGATSRCARGGHSPRPGSRCQAGPA
jgi:hypothetical protein